MLNSEYPFLALLNSHTARWLQVHVPLGVVRRIQQRSLDTAARTWCRLRWVPPPRMVDCVTHLGHIAAGRVCRISRCTLFLPYSLHSLLVSIPFSAPRTLSHARTMPATHGTIPLSMGLSPVVFVPTAVLGGTSPPLRRRPFVLRRTVPVASPPRDVRRASEAGSSSS